MSATEFKQPTSVLIPISFAKGEIKGEIDTAHCLNALQLTKEGVMTHQEMNRVVVPCLTPDRAEKKQNGRRFKDDGEPSYTLTAQDIQGVGIEVKEATKQGYAVAHPGDSINLTMPDSKTRRGRVGGVSGSDIGHTMQSGSDGSQEGEYP